MSKLRISEIYETIQGESLAAGKPCLMVRLTGCPMRCVWCDSAFAFTGGNEIAVDEIIDTVVQSSMPTVEITGGEPLAQKSVVELMRGILAKWREQGVYKELLLETTAFFDLSVVPKNVIKIVDVKCPGSGEERANKMGHLAALNDHDQLKFVIKDRNDFEWAKRFVAINKELCHERVLLFSPVHASVKPSDLAEWIVAEEPQARMQLQMHKYIWPGAERGV